MIAQAQATVKKVSEDNIVFEVTCFNVTKTVTEPLVGRNPMLGWGQTLKINQKLAVEISANSDDEWRICALN